MSLMWKTDFPVIVLKYDRKNRLYATDKLS